MYRLRLYTKGKKMFIDVPLMFAAPHLANNWAFDMMQQDKGIEYFQIASTDNQQAVITRKNCIPVEKFDYSLFKTIMHVNK